jgi:hypothetical protein
MTILIPQDYAMAADSRGARGSVTLQDLRSGTYFGQMQLRGSILAIKDNSTTASGYMAFGASMTAIPTSAATGTGVYIDYTGIYGIASGTPKFTLDATTGVLTATDAVISGTITATAGAIGGFSIGTDYVRDAANSFGLASTVTGGDDVRFWAGAAFASRATAPFRITEAGVVTATSGTIGAWTLSTTDFRNSGGTVLLRGAGNLAFGATPPTSASAGTGIFIDHTGIYGLASNTKQFYLQASDGKAYAGAGTVILDTAGVAVYSSAVLQALLDSTGFYVVDNAKVGIGTLSPEGGFEKYGTTSQTIFNTTVSDTASSNFAGRRARAGTTAVQSGDILVSFGGRGYDGNSWVDASPTRVAIKASETFSATNKGSRMEFETTAIGGTTRSAKMVILDDGKVGIGATPGTALFEVDGSVIFNESGADKDFRVESDGQSAQFFVDGGTNRIGIRTNAPTTTLDLNDSTIRIRTTRTPASASATGEQGEFCWDATYFYICVATDTWERTEHVSW